MGRGFTSGGQELGFAFGAAVYKIHARKCYTESLPPVPKGKETTSSKVKGLVYSCLFIVCLPSRSRTPNIDIWKPPVDIIHVSK